MTALGKKKSVDATEGPIFSKMLLFGLSHIPDLVGCCAVLYDNVRMEKSQKSKGGGIDGHRERKRMRQLKK